MTFYDVREPCTNNIGKVNELTDLLEASLMRGPMQECHDLDRNQGSVALPQEFHRPQPEHL